MSKKRLDEYFAKVVLENCFHDRFDVLEVSDKPDLRHKTSSTGIEVTYATPSQVTEAMIRWFQISQANESQKQDNIDWLRKRGYDYQDNAPFPFKTPVYGDTLKDTMIGELYDIVKAKIKKLNSPTANYAPLDHYELFVRSNIIIPVFQEFKVVNELAEYNIGEKKFERIYLLSFEEKLYVFDMLSGTINIKYLYNRSEKMLEKAKELC